VRAGGSISDQPDGRSGGLGRCGPPLQSRMKIRDYIDFSSWWRRGPVVSVLRFEGVIMPRLRRGAISLGSHGAAIEKAFRLPGLVAVAIVINSPGGSAAQSGLICRRIRQLAAEKQVPVIAFAEDVAASGGYWLALAGDEIFGEETSIFGSIGVISAGFGFTRLIERLGIERRLHTAGSRKALLDPFLPEDPEDAARLAGLQRDIHESFKEQVRGRRAGKIDPGDETLFNGDVFTGRKALDRGLIDGIGELHAVMQTRYGENVRLRPIAVERRRSFRWLLPFVYDPLASIADLADGIEARLFWARFGL
jgi:signal peptide peptidase SppA